MSSHYVRSLARNWVNFDPNIPFHETINKGGHPHDDLWVTLEFHSEYVEDLTTMGCGKMEYGTIDLVFFAKSGTVDLALPPIEIFIDEFMKNKDMNNKVSLLGRDVLETFDSEGEQYRIIQGISYAYGY